jgi:hypothetical protein
MVDGSQPSAAARKSTAIAVKIINAQCHDDDIIMVTVGGCCCHKCNL